MAPAASATNKPTLQANVDDDVCQSPSSEMMMATSPTSASASAEASHSQLPKQDTAFLSPPTSPGLLLDNDNNESQDADQHPRAGPSSQPFIFPGGPKASKQQQQQQRSTRPGMSSSSSAQQHRQPMLRSASEDVGRSSGTGTGSSYSQRSTSYAGGTASNPHSRQASKEYKETLDARTKDEKDGTRIINQYHLTRVIGQGAYGVVYQGCLRDDPSQVFAVKEFSKTRLNKSRRYDRMRRPPPRKQGTRASASNSGSGGGDNHGQGQGADSPQQPTTPRDPLEPIRREIAIMKKLDHPNVISLIEALDDPRRDELYLVVEYCSDGPIINVKLHEQTTPLPESKAQDYFVQMLLGLEFLHHNDIIHRDIKPDNVLLCDGGKTCKIVDFGVSEMFTPNDGVEARGSEDGRQRPKGQGTPAFLSPELCSVNSGGGSTAGGGGSAGGSSSKQTTSRTNSYDDDHGGETDGPSPRELNGRRDDVWALGVTLYCMLVGHLPFDKDNFMDLYEAIRTQDPEYPSHLSRSARDLLESLLEKDPTKRITTIEAAREHPWVTVEGQQPLVPAARNLEQVVVEVTEEEIKGAICRITSIFTIARAVTKFKRARSRSSMNTTSSPGQSPKPQQQEGGAGFASTIASMVSSPQSSFSLSSPTSTSHAQTVGSPVQHHRQSRQLLQSHQQRRGSGADGEGGSGNGSGGPLGMLTSALGALSTTTAAAGGEGEEQEQEQQVAGEKRGVASPPPTLTEEPEDDEVESERRSSRSRSRSSVEPHQQGAQDDHDAPTQGDTSKQAPSSDNRTSSSNQADALDQPPEHEHEHSLSSLLSDLEARLERKMRRAWPSGAERFFVHHHGEVGRDRGREEGGGDEEGAARAKSQAGPAKEGDDAREREDDKGQAGNAQAEGEGAASSSSPSSFFQEAARRLPAWLTGAPQPGEASSGVRRTSDGDEDDENGQQLKVRLFAAEGQPVVKSPGPAPTEVVEDMRRELGD